jgi:hypothetical protein
MAMVSGLIVFFLFIGAASNCGSENLTEIASCQNGTAGLHIGFGVLVFGAFLVLGASVASVRRAARARRVSVTPKS